jgi:hypothetical protein
LEKHRTGHRPRGSMRCSRPKTWATSSRGETEWTQCFSFPRRPLYRPVLIPRGRSPACDQCPPVEHVLVGGVLSDKRRPISSTVSIAPRREAQHWPWTS